MTQFRSEEVALYSLEYTDFLEDGHRRPSPRPRAASSSRQLNESPGVNVIRHFQRNLQHFQHIYYYFD
jgi:hypothetical protein